MRVDRVDSAMVNTDLGAVNAARVSFAKESETLDDQDCKLIRYLVNNNHWSPLAHPHIHLLIKLKQIEMLKLATVEHPGLRVIVPTPGVATGYFVVTGSFYAITSNLHLFTLLHQDRIKSVLIDIYPEMSDAMGIKTSWAYSEQVNDVIQLSDDDMWRDYALRSYITRTVRVRAPLFIARQLVKHQVGLVWNEVSRRYVDDDPTFWRPKEWRARALKVKQGSSDKIIKANWFARGLLWAYERTGVGLYKLLLKMDVAPEMARIVLPVTMETEWWWTGTLDAFDRIFKLRLDPHAQQETREVALLMKEALRDS